MSQLGRLQEWYNKTLARTTLVNVPLGELTTLVEDNPLRIFLWIKPTVGIGGIQYIPTGPQIQSAIIIPFDGGNDNNLIFHIDREYCLTQSGYSCLIPGDTADIVIIEVLMME